MYLKIAAKLFGQHLLLIFLLLTVENPECAAESFEPFGTRVEFSNTGLTFCIIKSESDDKKAEISCYSRLAIDTEFPLKAETDLIALMSGKVVLLRSLKLDYVPAMVRISDRQLVLLDKYGLNRHWLEKNPALKVYGLRSIDEKALALNEIVEIPPITNYLSRSYASWLRGATFSTNQETFYISLRNPIGVSDMNLALVAFDLSTVGAKTLSEVDLMHCASDVPKNFLAEVFDIARGNRYLAFDSLSQKVLEDASVPLSARVSAAHYRYAVFGDLAALKFLRKTASLYLDEKNYGADFIDLSLEASARDDAVFSALEIIKVITSPSAVDSEASSGVDR